MSPFHLIANLFAGSISLWSFAPWSYYPLIILSLAIALFSWSQLPARQAKYYGHLFGFFYVLGSVYWVYYSLHDYGNAHPAFAILAVIVLAAILALYYALLAWLFAKLKQPESDWKTYLLLFPSLWTLVEYLRSFSTVGFPWNLAGQALIDSPLAGVFPVVGVYGASFIVAFLAGAGVCLLRCQSLRSRASAIAVAVLLIIVGFASSFAQWTAPAASQPISYALIQANVEQNLKFERDSFKKIVNDYRSLTRKHLGSEIIVWPETAIPVYAKRLQTMVLPRLAPELRKANSHLLTGTFARSDAGVHNSILNVSDGSLYHKKRLVPFGETIPLRGLLAWFSKLIVIPMSDLTSAPSSVLTKVGAHQVGLSICYESAFPSDVMSALPQADYLVNVSNDSWFGDSIGLHQLLQITRLRAAEAGRNLLRATSTGITAVIDFRGKIVDQSELFVQQVLTGRIQARQGATPYSSWGNLPVLLLTVLLLLWYGWSSRTTRRKDNG